MGIRDSTQTRVVPVFDALSYSFLPRLLQLVADGQVQPTGPIEEACWGSEKALRPPNSLLKWLVENLELQPNCSVGSSRSAIQKRKALIAGDEEVRREKVRREALDLLAKPRLPAQAWYILEGPSYPDVFIQTASVIVVIEGKRTERRPTRSTSWMPCRDQLLRHLDCAWEIRGDRSVFGLMIVEAEEDHKSFNVPEPWLNWMQESKRDPVLSQSLPHRSEEERDAIAASILGMTTWQKVCQEFRIAWDSLPDLCG